MPPKVRELIAELERNGFSARSGKGSHRVYSHPKSYRNVVISGKEGNDAQKYQIKQIKEALNEIKGK